MYIEIKDGKIVGVSEQEFAGSVLTDKTVIRGADGYFYFSGEEPDYPDDRSYVEKRLSAYPSFREFLDAQVKLNSGSENLAAEGKDQLERYYQACLDVKTTYPKDDNN